MTAVEWLLSQKMALTSEEFDEIVQQALEMEKQQIIEAWIATDNELQRLAAETYYNETYKPSA